MVPPIKVALADGRGGKSGSRLAGSGVGSAVVSLFAPTVSSGTVTIAVDTTAELDAPVCP
jgi:galactokinase